MTPDKWESLPFCPYLAAAPDDRGRLRVSSRHLCEAGDQPRAISAHRQTASCLSSGYSTCPDYPDGPEYSEQEARSGPFRWASIDSTLAEVALVCLMAGMIVFSVYSIAPRPHQAAPPEPPVAASTAVVAAPAEGESATQEVAIGATATPLPAPTATATPARATPTAARAPAPAPTSAAGKTYVVKPGDTLFSIARTHRVSVDALAQANGLSDPRRLRAGQTLRIP